MALTTVAAYDVREDSRRARLAALLQSYGDRIQKSVFLLGTAPEDLDTLCTRAADIIDAETDSVWIIRQCSDCWEVVIRIGQAEPPAKVLLWAVM
ncbi:MAG: CRISPR-associated endonuclease Cas2 [Verrucomicrobiota bacterium]|nr:CRISPR-associated endonuclease Cas2 [Verrucomicrobiota bacterium]